MGVVVYLVHGTAEQHTHHLGVGVGQKLGVPELGLKALVPPHEDAIVDRQLHGAIHAGGIVPILRGLVDEPLQPLHGGLQIHEPAGILHFIIGPEPADVGIRIVRLGFEHLVTGFQHRRQLLGGQIPAGQGVPVGAHLLVGPAQKNIPGQIRLQLPVVIVPNDVEHLLGNGDAALVILGADGDVGQRPDNIAPGVLILDLLKELQIGTGLRKDHLVAEAEGGGPLLFDTVQGPVQIVEPHAQLVELLDDVVPILLEPIQAQQGVVDHNIHPRIQVGGPVHEHVGKGLQVPDLVGGGGMQLLQLREQVLAQKGHVLPLQIPHPLGAVDLFLVPGLVDGHRHLEEVVQLQDLPGILYILGLIWPHMSFLTGTAAAPA